MEMKFNSIPIGIWVGWKNKTQIFFAFILLSLFYLFYFSCLSSYLPPFAYLPCFNFSFFSSPSILFSSSFSSSQKKKKKFLLFPIAWKMMRSSSSSLFFCIFFIKKLCFGLVVVIASPHLTCKQLLTSMEINLPACL